MLYKVYVKRMLDLFLALVSIVFFSPVMLIVAILIKLNSPGPVIFKQQRLTKQGREFTIYKFRSMCVDAPEQSAHTSDFLKSYVTTLGRSLRNTGLDELPQMFNVLKGDISIVGPRPCLCNDYELIDLRNKYNISDIRPGLTSLSKIDNIYGHQPKEKIKVEIKYLENLSFWLDMKIFFGTIGIVLLGRNEK